MDRSRNKAERGALVHGVVLLDELVLHHRAKLLLPEDEEPNNKPEGNEAKADTKHGPVASSSNDGESETGPEAAAHERLVEELLGRECLKHWGLHARINHAKKHEAGGGSAHALAHLGDGTLKPKVGQENRGDEEEREELPRDAENEEDEEGAERVRDRGGLGSSNGSEHEKVERCAGDAFHGTAVDRRAEHGLDNAAPKHGNGEEREAGEEGVLDEPVVESLELHESALCPVREEDGQTDQGDVVGHGVNGVTADDKVGSNLTLRRRQDGLVAPCAVGVLVLGLSGLARGRERVGRRTALDRLGVLLVVAAAVIADDVRGGTILEGLGAAGLHVGAGAAVVARDRVDVIAVFVILVGEPRAVGPAHVLADVDHDSAEEDTNEDTDGRTGDGQIGALGEVEVDVALLEAGRGTVAAFKADGEERAEELIHVEGGAEEDDGEESGHGPVAPGQDLAVGELGPSELPSLLDGGHLGAHEEGGKDDVDEEAGQVAPADDPIVLEDDGGIVAEADYLDEDEGEDARDEGCRQVDAACAGDVFTHEVADEHERGG
mmetsp:Transcript_23907/g.76266  ORF Transcript_23907/g.76266 Transcript_23907/m.76266 type:complete len:550 (-) Transcript_23907:160-1809(-)